MHKARKAVYLLCCLLSVIVMAAALLSVFRDTPNRYLKMLDFPRIQLFWLSLAGLLLFVLMTRRWRWYDYAFVVGLLGGTVVQARYLINYTPLVATAVPDAAERVMEADRFRLLVLNVLEENRQTGAVERLIREEDPDVLLLMETTPRWLDALRPVTAGYNYRREVPNERGYGMLLYSRLPLENVTVHYLSNEDVPSIESDLQLENGRTVRLWAVHPVPPTRFDNLPDNAGEEEVAMKRVGNKIKDSPYPVVVAGDINDVVWSQTDALMGTEDLMHDVRVGRWPLNTFDAGKWYLRWPLDHVFVTEEFRLARLKRGAYVGSDHYPVVADLVLPGR